MTTILLPNDAITGTNNPDFLRGSQNSDFIFGLNGDDSILGKGGNDTLYGDLGNDLLRGGSGNDWLNGGFGNDLIFGDAGNDDLNGDHGNDILIGGTGDDLLTGGKGNDILVGGAGNDRLLGGEFYSFTIVPFPLVEPTQNNQFDILTGGKGADTFIVRTFGPTDAPVHPYLGNGFAIITDFNRLEGDRIELLGFENNHDYSFTNTIVGTKISFRGDPIALVINAEIDPTADVNFVSGFAPIF